MPHPVVAWGKHRVRADCPNCQAIYDIPDHLLVAGRKVRCARCATNWSPAPAEVAEAAPPEPAPPAPEVAPPEDVTFDPPAALPTAVLAMPPDFNAMDRLAMEATVPRSPLALKAAWGVSLAVLVILVASVIVWRDAVAHAWPPSERVLGVFGMAPPK